MTRDEYARRLWMAGGVALAMALLFVGFRKVADVLLLLFAGALFAVVVDTAARAVARWTPVPRKVAVLSVFLLIAAVLGFAAWWSGPRILDQLTALLERIPEVVSDIRASVVATEWGRPLVERLERTGGAMPDGAQALGGVTGMFSTVTGAATSTLIVIAVTIFVAWSPRVYHDSLLRLLPEGEPRERFSLVLSETAASLRLWMGARLLSMTVVGVLTGIALTVAGIPLALVLALIAAILAFIPFIGPILSAFPAVLIGLGEGMQTALIVVGIYMGVQFLESYFVTPIIEKEVVSLPAAFLIAAQVIAGTLFGLVGIFLATPLAVTVVVLVRRLYMEDVLGQEITPLGA